MNPKDELSDCWSKIQLIESVLLNMKQQRWTQIGMDAVVHIAVDSWALDYFDAFLDS